MKIKKILTGALALCTVASVFVGCSNDTAQGGDETGVDTIKVGVDLKFYPFHYIDDEGNPAGMEVDIAYAFGEYIGKEIEIVNTDFPMLIPALDTGNVDIVISDMSVAPDRMEKADFSTPYRYARTLALVNKDFATEHNITDQMSQDEFFAIEGFKFAGLSGTIAASVPLSHGAEVTEFPDIATVLLELESGGHHAHVGAETVRGDHAALKDTTIIYNNIEEYSASCFVVKKGNTELLEKADEFVASMYAEGGFYDLAGDKYDAGIGEFLQDDTLGLEYIITEPAYN